jgi:hypothetical protein
MDNWKDAKVRYGDFSISMRPFSPSVQGPRKYVFKACGARGRHLQGAANSLLATLYVFHILKL